MRLFFANKAVRLLLAISVSIWMAGGCLFGCSSNAVGAEVAVESCPAHRPHDCSAKQKPNTQVATTLKQLPRGAMTECPLVVNSTAATAKSYTHLPDPARTAVADLPRFEKQTADPDHALFVPLQPTRGPTHLRCCVFLI